MGKAIRCISAGGTGLLLAACLSSCGGAGSNDVAVARVGASAITKLALDHWTSVGSTAAGQVASSSQTSGARAALRLLISAGWTLGEAAEMGIAVTDGEVRTQLATYHSDQSQGVPFENAAREASFLALLGRSGETSADERWLMKLNLLAFELEQRRVREAERAIDRGEVSHYYSDHKRDFVVPETRDLEVLGSYHEAAVIKAKREIQAGANFVTVAKRMSIDGEAPEGLQLGLKRGQEEKEYERNVFAAKPGVLTGPLKVSFYYLFQVLKIRPSRLPTLAQSEASIRRLLVARRRPQLSAQWLHAIERTWTARTDCRPAYVVPKCRQYTANAQI